MLIKHLQHKDIDYARWDKHISQSSNQLTYAYTWYLDIVSPKWEALVTEDYEYIMPLPVKRRYGLPYLVQPILTQQLGIFSTQIIDEKVVKDFIKELPSFSYELNLNKHNYHSGAIEFPNYILNLNQSYKQISAHYSKNTQRNIDKSAKLNLTIKDELELSIFINFFFSENKHDVANIKTVVVELLEKGIAKRAITLYGVYSTENNLVAALCVMHSANRINYLLPISNTEGKTSSAMFLLVDKLIHDNTETNRVLDFEGSAIEGIARFYKGFGAKNEPYYVLKRFRPSFLMRKLKK